MKIPSILSGCGLLLAFPLTALAADEQPLSAAAGLTTDSFTLILKIGVPSGLISGLITLLVAYWNNKAAQKNNLDKIKSDTDNISRQINQRQHEFEIQTKMQLESLHSDEKKKVCADFLASVNPSLFPNKQFDFEKMNSCLTPLYLYCNDNHFSYFENLARFVTIRELSTFGERYEQICKQQIDLNRTIKGYAFVKDMPEIPPDLLYNIEGYHQKLGKVERHEEIMNGIMESYTHHYELALEAAKKLIWNEPIEKAQPLQLEDLPDEDDI